VSYDYRTEYFRTFKLRSEFIVYGVTTCVENLEMSGNLTAVREMSGNNLVTGKLPKTVYCKLHICVHTGI